MKRIALLICGLLFVVANTAEAVWYTPTSGRTYTQPVRTVSNGYTTRTTQPVRTASTNYTTRPAQPAQVVTAGYRSPTTQPVRATTASYSAAPVRATTASYSTSTAQGVANIMASTGRVGHFGGNTGYEGCGAGSSPAAAFNNCCYANSGMSTVDVGYARGANGMWFCCRRYR